MPAEIVADPRYSLFGSGMTCQAGKIAQLERIILACTVEGELILDPFAGSSTTGVAAVRLSRRYIGLELDASYVALSTKRLKKALDQERARWRELLVSGRLQPSSTSLT